MKIIELTAENFKRLKAVDITPDEHMQVIGGRNAQGKTSVLDAIWLALGGGSASKATKKPIRDGEDQASVRLDLGDLVVERKWKGDKTTLAVTAADGAKYTSPQAMLDSLVGRLSFDPLEFTRLSAREQMAALLDLVDIDVDLDAMAAERQRLYDERTQVGRDGVALGEKPRVDEGTPTEERSATVMLDEISEAEASNRSRAELINQQERAAQEVADAKRALADAEVALSAANKAAAKAPALLDTDAMRTELNGIEESNRAIRENNRRREIVAQIEFKRGEYDGLTAKIKQLDEARTKALAAAKFPVDGLGFDDDGVTYNGVPFSQASSAEQIRVSLAMAMALNPKLKVIRILDGSLLDDESMALIADMAKGADYQVLIERVGNADEGAVIIEDGQVSA